MPAPNLVRGPALLQLALLDQRSQRHLVQGRNHQVGTGPRQQIPAAEVRDADHRHAARLGGLHPAAAVVDHHTPVGGQSELLRRAQEDHRVGLAASQLAPGQFGVEQVLQCHALADDAVVEALLGDERVEPDLLQERPDVLRRRRRRDPHPGGLHRQDEPQRVGEGHEPSLVDERDETLLLDGRVALGPPLHVGHSEVLQRGAGTG